MSRTLGTARTIFGGTPDGGPSLMQEVLEYIQAEIPQQTSSLPTELRLTSQTLLSSLPSSNHFLLLPSNVRFYKPYVDGDFITASGTGPFLQKLDVWFQKALLQVQGAIAAWFADLHSVHDVWKIRRWASTWIRAAPGLQEQERTAFTVALDIACQQRATSVWKAALSSASVAFRDRLESSLTALKPDDFGTWMSSATPI